MNAVLQFLVLNLLRNVYSYNECVNGQCGCCKYNTCQLDGFGSYFCSGGCSNGYYGYQCRDACHASCLTCTSIHNCDSCKTGYYGIRCNKCSDGCLSNECSPSSGSCMCKIGYIGERCDKCVSGKYGPSCNWPCPIKCLTCYNYDSCSYCKNGFWGTVCQHNCPIGCNTCHKVTAICNYNCRPGYYGLDCKPCQENCERCSSRTYCLACVQGFYGPTCSSNCPSNCHDRTCHTFDGTCLQCRKGFFGRHCEHNCSKRCTDVECDIYTGKCFSCISGYYGGNCTDPCPMNCRTCLSEKQCSLCDTRYYGQSCQSECLNCKEGTECDKWNGYCKECPIGLYGRACQYSCSFPCKSCELYYGHQCTECVDGKYGEIPSVIYPHCSYNCPSNCWNKTCDSMSGYCLGGCLNGSWGDHCNKRCSDNCKDQTCFQNNGHCINGCKDGYTGPICNCPSNCECSANGFCYGCKDYFENTQRNCTCTKDLCSNVPCSHCTSPDFYPDNSACCPCSKQCKDNSCVSTLKCTFGCKEGYRGEGCSEQCKDFDIRCTECSVHYTWATGKCLKCIPGYYIGNTSHSCIPCSNGCLKGICHRTNGECTSGCKEGRWGIMCDRLCSNDCQTCDQTNGTCLVCKAGKYLSDCSKSCSINCNASIDARRCAIENGACLNGCDSSHKYGTRCENVCNSNCKDNECDWKTGDCVSGCVFNHYGKQCQNECNVRCENANGTSPCNSSTGECVAGCYDGYFGSFCDQICSPNCANNTCRRTTGTCYFGCTFGYVGSDCVQKASKSSESSDNTGVKNGLAIGVVVIVAILIGVAIAFLAVKRRRKEAKAGESRNLSENNIDNDTVTYSEVRARARDIDEDNAVYAKPNKPKKRTTEQARMTNTLTNVLEAVIATNQLKEMDHENRKMVGYQHFEESITDTAFDDLTRPKYVNDIRELSSRKPSAATKPRVVYENANVTEAVIRMSNAEYASIQTNDSVLEIEEDLGNMEFLVSNSDQYQKVYLTKEMEGEYGYYNVAEMKKRKIPLKKLAEYVSKKTKEELMEQFDTLPVGLVKPFTESQKPENLTKNRYRGLYPYDQRRVILKGGDSDYINASFLDGYMKLNAYIASIGPTYKYMEDMSPFWRMVWQEKVGKIVMLTKLSEAGVPKCDQYWPEKDSSIQFGAIRVTTEHVELYADFTVRSFVLQKDSASTHVVQVQFMAWPDKSIPDDVTSLIEFRQKVKNISIDLDGPVLVHCSAGVGRTGTYIAIDSLIQEGETEGGVDIYACVRNLREQRVNMVQTSEQYQYLHNIVAHTLTFGSKPIKAAQFHEYMSAHTINQLGNQIQQLEAFVESRSDEEKEAAKLNKELKDQNRSGADIPGDNNRPRLYLRRQQGISGYINAMFVNSYRIENRFLVAQTPLPNTVEDFLTLIVQEKVSCIVSMESNLNGNKTVGTYIPVKSQPLKVGSCTVHFEEEECKDQYVQRKLRILYQGKSRKQEVTVKHIQFTKWIEKQKIPDDPKMFMRFVRDVQLKCDCDDKERPILIHCLTGGEKSGLFCVVSILLEKIQLEQEISVVNTVRKVKNRRHISIPNKEQYIFCHQCLDEYLHTFDTYSNFRIDT